MQPMPQRAVLSSEMHVNLRSPEIIEKGVETMKRSFKTLSAILAVIMLVSLLPVTALAAPITGDSTVDNVTIVGIFPTTLDFALDPLELDSLTTSQIATANYMFVNKTEAPIRVDLDLTLTPEDEEGDVVTVVSDASELDQDDTSVTTKMIYFASIGATGITTVNELAFAYNPAEDTAPVMAYPANPAAAATMTPFIVDEDDGTGATSIAFALDKATASAAVIDTLAAENKGVCAFQFYGKLNTYAAWEAGDVTISGTYTLTALRASTYTAYNDEDDSAFITGSLNQLDLSVPVTELTVTGEGGAASVVNGGTLQMHAAANASATTSTSVTWSVPEDNEVATIDANGLLTAIGLGTVTVTATSVSAPGVTGTLNVTVTAAPVALTGLTVTGEGNATTVNSGGTLQMIATPTPAEATNASVTWSVENGTGTATIDEDTGVLTGGETMGTVTVTATSDADGDITDTAVITVTYSDAGFIDGASATTVAAYPGAAISSSKAAATAITIPFYFDDLTITSLVMTTGGFTIPEAEYTISGNNLVLVKTNPSCVLRGVTTGVKSVTVTLSDNSTYTFSITITA
jgi:hypothetical protein